MLLPLSAGLLQRYCAIPPAAIWMPQWPPLAASLIMGGSVWLLRIVLERRVADALALPLLIVVGIAVYALMVRLTMPAVVARFARGRL